MHRGLALLSCSGGLAHAAPQAANGSCVRGGSSPSRRAREGRGCRGRGKEEAGLGCGGARDAAARLPGRNPEAGSGGAVSYR